MSTAHPPPAGGKPPRERTAVQAWVPMIVMDIVLPTLTYFLLTGLTHVDEVPALLISGIWPAIEITVVNVRQRHLDEFGVFVLVGIGLGVVTTLLSDNARAVFMKDSITTGLLGLVMLATLVGKPLTYYLGRRFATDGSKAQRDWWDGLWKHPQFRRVQRHLGAVWGIALVAEAAIRAVLTWRLGTSAMVVVNNVVPYVIIAVLILYSIRTGRRSQARAAQRHGAAAVAPPQEPPPVA